MEGLRSQPAEPLLHHPELLRPQGRRGVLLPLGKDSGSSWAAGCRSLTRSTASRLASSTGRRGSERGHRMPRSAGPAATLTGSPTSCSCLALTSSMRRAGLIALSTTRSASASQHPTWCAGLGLSWGGVEGRYVDAKGELVAFDPSVHEPGPGHSLSGPSPSSTIISATGLELFWTVLGEKQLIGGGHAPSHPGWLEVNGAPIG